MALINQRTGFYGFTVDGIDGIKSDITGSVKKCIISFAYQLHLVDVDFTISNGAEDWGVLMGDGSIIPLSNPKVLYSNRDNAIVEFDMESEYAANSPCILVYRSDSARFYVKEHIGENEFIENTLSGHFAFTTEGYGGNAYENGYVDRLLITVPFPLQIADIEFTISDGEDHWGARMGDGSIINLRNPEVIVTNTDNAVVKFDMETPYPSNSPCVVVYRNKDAHFHVKVVTKAKDFVPVTDIINTPSNFISGKTIDLSSCSVYPSSATYQVISWSVLSGDATINGDSITINSSGDITLKATVYSGSSEDGTDFVKEFHFYAEENKITILAQPTEKVSMLYGSIDGFISVNVESDTGVIAYKWYCNTVNSISGAVPLENGDTNKYTFPTDMDLGTYYYFCEITSPGATSVVSNISEVVVNITLEGIVISPRPDTLDFHARSVISVNPIPANAVLDLIVWESSNVTIIQVDSNGNLYAVGSGTATITAKTSDGKFSDQITITVAEHVPVDHIEDVFTEIDNNTEYNLSATVIPSNATNKNIQWSIINDGDTGAKIIDNNIIKADLVGTIIVRATIENGASELIDYTQDFTININQKFIPVEDITVELPDIIRIGDSILLNSTIIPTNATNKTININIKDAGETGANIENDILTFTNEGECSIQIVVSNGASVSKDFVKDITLSIYPKWITVESIIGLPERFEDVSESLQLSGSVYPANASYNNIIFTLESYPEELVVTMDENNVLYIENYMEAEWWVENPEPTPPYYYDKWLENITDPIVIGVKVPNGIAVGEDYVTSIAIGIQSPTSPDIHIPLENIDLVLPSIVRARRPILMSRVEKEPWTATNGAVKISFVRATTRQGGFALSFLPSSETPEYWKENENIELIDEYDWNQEGYYLYIFEDIDTTIIYHVENGMPDGTAYRKEVTIKVLPEYIPVSNITNIPTKLPYNSETQLHPELHTNFNISKVNTEVYDVEIPSYSDVNWKVINQGRTGAKIINGVLSFTGTGTAIIEAEVPNGIHEEYTWYDDQKEGESYTQRFTITVTNSEKEYDEPIVKLTLDNNTVVNVRKISELYNLSNDKPSNSYIEAGGVTFRKDQVMSIEFWDSNITVDNTKYVEDITLSKSNVSTYSANIPEKSTLSFDSVVPSDDQDGTILIDNEDSEFNEMRILPENVFMDTDGTILRYFDNENPDEIVEDLILNVKYASNVFKVNHNNIYFPDGFVRYDNGWMKIPAGTILSTNGNLIIPNPDYTSEDGTINEEAYPMLYEISIHGVVFDHVNGKTILPDGSEVRASGIIKLPDDYLYNHNTINFSYNTSTSTKSVPLVHGSYINNNNELCLLDETISNLDNLKLVSSDSGDFIRLSDGSFIYQNGMIYTVNGKLFDIYKNEITSFINLSNNYIITPLNATNQNIEWSITSGPSGTNLIKIPTTGTSTFIIVAGNKSGQVVLNADIVTATGIKEFRKKFLVNVGTVSTTNGKLIAINLSGLNKNVYKGSSRVKVNFKASLLGTNSSIVNDSIDDIEWEIDGNTSWLTRISTSSDNLSAVLNIYYRESVNNTITVTARCGDISESCEVHIYSEFSDDEPYVESLANFARNFSNLTSINHIPSTVNGDDCLRNFMMGCTSFNQNITIPSYVEGDRCLKGFLSGCTSFNKPITIPNNVTGTKCLDRFLAGCTSFNQEIAIPNGVTGDECLLRFLEGCTSFNKLIVLPTNVSGKQCLDHFLFNCTSFNQPITIPDGISGVACMRGFMRNTIKMTSRISISEEAANNCEVNGLTLSCFTRDDAYDVGVPVIGTGADIFKEKCPNMLMLIPLRNLI